MAEENEYEYEYYEHETETFHVDLDLSTLNPVIKHFLTASKSRKPTDKAKETPTTQTPDPDDTTVNAPAQDDAQAGRPDHTPEAPAQDAAEEQDNGGSTLATSVQVLDLASNNPIISYRDQVYSCRWVDLIGTNLFFTPPTHTEDDETLVSTDEYDLVGMSTVKLLGHRANVKPSSKKRSRQEADGEDASGDIDAGHSAEGRSLGTLIRTNPKRNVQIKKQAAFLERLMDIKQRRGDRDIVRAFVDESIASAEHSQFTESMRTELEHLNRRVVRGDAEALGRLQTIYAQLGDEDATEPSR